MKYLKNIQNFILESKGRSEEIYKDEFMQLLKNNCKEFLKDPFVRAYRGNYHDDISEFLFVRPSLHERRSANTKNIYTLLIDNSLRWEEYPKRSKSIICSTADYTAEGYGYLYAVIPFDGAKFGVCPSSDIWFSFKGIEIDVISSVLVNKLDVSDKDFESMLKGLNELEKKVRTNNIPSDADYMKQYLSEYKQKLTSNNSLTLYEFLDDLLDPVKNGFSLSSYGELPSGDKEVWTDSDCLLISKSQLKNLFE